MTVSWRGSVGKGTILELSSEEERISTQGEKEQEEEKQKGTEHTEDPTALISGLFLGGIEKQN